MNPNEFKAWFEGFSENLSGPPNLTQWKKIMDRVKQIDDHAPATPYPVYIEKYVKPHYPGWSPIWHNGVSNSDQLDCTGIMLGGIGKSDSMALYGGVTAAGLMQNASNDAGLDNYAAFKSLGCHEFKSLAA